jgi:hypothetical protein
MSSPANIAYLISWTESERGWGCRPDGYSLHVGPQEAVKYVKSHNDSLPAGPAPDEYSRADGDAVAVEATPTLMARLKVKGSLRFWQGDLKVEQGITGARTVRDTKDVTTMSFLEQCLKKKSKPEDIDEFIAMWDAGDKALPLKDALGVSEAELALVQANSANIFRVLYERQGR